MPREERGPNTPNTLLFETELDLPFTRGSSQSKLGIGEGSSLIAIAGQPPRPWLTSSTSSLIVPVRPDQRVLISEHRRREIIAALGQERWADAAAGREIRLHPQAMTTAARRIER